MAETRGDREAIIAKNSKNLPYIESIYDNPLVEIGGQYILRSKKMHYHIYMTRENDTVRRIFGASKARYPTQTYEQFRFLVNKLRKEIGMKNIKMPTKCPKGARDYYRFKEGHPFVFCSFNNAAQPVPKSKSPIKKKTPVTKASTNGKNKSSVRRWCEEREDYVDKRFMAIEQAHKKEILKLRSEVVTLRAELLELKRKREEKEEKISPMLKCTPPRNRMKRVQPTTEIPPATIQNSRRTSVDLLQLNSDIVEIMTSPVGEFTESPILQSYGTGF